MSCQKYFQILHLLFPFLSVVAIPTSLFMPYVARYEGWTMDKMEIVGHNRERRKRAKLPRYYCLYNTSTYV